jgi:hypothetical protein
MKSFKLRKTKHTEGITMKGMTLQGTYDKCSGKAFANPRSLG